MPIKINLISLGCAKNLIDSENMLAKINENNIIIKDDIIDSDVVIINTCGFIESAKAEAIEQILEIVELKKQGIIKGIVVTGCLTQRYKDEFFKELPEVDAILGTGSYNDIILAINSALKNQRFSKFDDIDKSENSINRIVTTGAKTAYLKIAEGCNYNCSFCVIPSLRGKYRSRKMEDILIEAKNLAGDGICEIIVIAQDITRYGIDLYGEKSLVKLIKELCKLFHWVRLHYLYPDGITDELIDCIASEPNIVKYIDVPIQHAAAKILKAMNRNEDVAYLSNLIKKMRDKIPGAVFRTSIIVGFPGETDEDFTVLCEFLKEMKLERAGVFTYSREEGSISFDYPEQIEADVKNNRQMILEQIQSRILDEYNTKMIGQNIEVLTEGYEDNMYFGRSSADSLDVDGIVYFSSKDDVEIGEFVMVNITKFDEASLIGNKI